MQHGAVNARNARTRQGFTFCLVRALFVDAYAETSTS